MATGYTVLNALNRQTKAGIDETEPRARFRTRDLSIFKIYANEDNFYPQEDIEQKAGEILAIGLLEGLVVKYEPLEAVGEYKLISGERRWRALRLLVERGYKEFEFVTCNVVAPATSHEEKVAMIIANSHRNKDVATLLREENELKETLEEMKANGIELKGYNLQSGRIREVIAELLNISNTKAAQIEAVNNNLIPDFKKELDKNRLTFSAVYELSGMTEDDQKKALEILENTGELTYRTIKGLKEKPVSDSDTEEEAQNSEKSDEFETDKAEDPIQSAAGSHHEENAGNEARMAAGSEYQAPHPESMTSICYSCKNYSTCNVRTGTCRKCDQYINKAETEKTEEQRYSEEQDRIDRETARKLRQQADEERMEKLPSESPNGGHQVHKIKIGRTFFEEVSSGRKTFELQKNDRNYREGDVLELMEYAEGLFTGQMLKVLVTYILEDYTGIVDGYCIMAIERV
ncbi:DUF3850 domain-containing protein [Lachnospiraceae bacterium WCA-9-b2]|uniref:DUF3850 domain-containing protein n=2 Tax=Sporofaciens musculi TaxID=2681861 RepID=A0A7X3SK65_9FIRM|nr:DUF3850 domain-containing protein [Sporofaciens musculi]MXP77263.1 DUF3850 domain-containing protein [Sporofaciens musculi]